MLANNLRRGATQTLTRRSGRPLSAAAFYEPTQPHDDRQQRFLSTRLQTSPSIFNNVQYQYTHFQNSQQQQRSVVMVTKTKVAELPTDDVEDTATTNTDTPTYVTHSEKLIVTPSCLKRVEKLIQMRKEKDGTDAEDFFLRVFVDAGGCSGFQYQFEIDNDIDEDEGDMVLVSAAAGDALHPRIVIDETSLNFLEGATLDYVIEMIKSAFVVRDNPKSESACGCGSSFAMKNFEANPAMD